MWVRFPPEPWLAMGTFYSIFLAHHWQSHPVPSFLPETATPIQIHLIIIKTHIFRVFPSLVALRRSKGQALVSQPTSFVIYVCPPATTSFLDNGSHTCEYRPTATQPIFTLLPKFKFNQTCWVSIHPPTSRIIHTPSIDHLKAPSSVAYGMHLPAISR
ncbi:hypothetical protein B0H11DRAFT_2051938 [Mycena galericulata]|nr:hypothetical protein B0H11DRAFT_2051938 [Mycena galericulata]